MAFMWGQIFVLDPGAMLELDLVDLKEQAEKLQVAMHPVAMDRYGALI